jgi:hypothetical protein
MQEEYFLGSSLPTGAWNLNWPPLSFGRDSINGLKVREPEKANAVAISGEVTKECVAAFPSCRLLGFR